MIMQMDGSGVYKKILLENINFRKNNWVNIDLNNLKNEDNLRDRLSIPDIPFSALTAGDTRPRLVEFEEGLMIILRGVNFNPDKEPEDMVSLRIWLTKKLIVTFWKQNIKALDDVDKMYQHKEGPENPVDFFNVLVNSLVERISKVVSLKEDIIDELDEIVSSNRINELRVRVTESRIGIISLKRHLNPLKETFHKIINIKNTFFPLEIRQSLIEHSDTIIRCIEDLDSFRDRCSVIQEELNTIINEKMNRTIYQMSIIATIFLPLSLITGLLGINVGGIPGVDSGAAFFIVCVILVIIAIIEYIIFKKKNVI